jgi:hydrogenase maturation protein HypF
VKSRVHIAVRGAVQGVGFRPFIYKLASSLSLPGWVRNEPGGVVIDAEGEKELLDDFVIRIGREKPALASIQSMEFAYLDPAGYSTFEIRESSAEGQPATVVLPDIATCEDCLTEIFDPGNRRYRYPFTNCTNCGPRFTIIESLPYDRPNTSMKAFPMCETCRREYESPSNRRFHAQPIACPDCGPHLELWNSEGKVLAAHDDALHYAALMVARGDIVGLKGLGGFQLLVDAGNETAVRRLRERKHREEKPFALMVGNIAAVKELCELSALEERLLESPESPIVLLQKRRHILPANIAPGNNPSLGIMLPYTPLHHLLMRELGFPVVATSGNLSDEPICINNHEALLRLGGIADALLMHNRPIIRHADDSVVRLLMGRELVLRRGRGFAPLPVQIPFPGDDLVAVGAHLKNSVAVCRKQSAFLSQHIGDLETTESYRAFRQGLSDLQNMFAVSPQAIVSDLHPDYLSTQYARKSGLPRIGIQHHIAHIAACMADNDIEGRVLGVAWDGTGFGTDGTVWGGEFFITDGQSWSRFASFRPFSLPGGNLAVKECRRAALGVLFTVFGERAILHDELATVKAFDDSTLRTIGTMLARKINSPETSSVGRLFDAVASIAGIQQVNAFEGQAAMKLEFSIPRDPGEKAYRIAIYPSDKPDKEAPGTLTGLCFEVDWSLLVADLLDDLAAGVSAGSIAAKFHNGLAESIVDVARLAGERRIVLSGGCFQNRYLTERTVQRLYDENFIPYWHQRIPPNDGGIALGQLYAARMASH